MQSWRRENKSICAKRIEDPGTLNFWVIFLFFCQVCAETMQELKQAAWVVVGGRFSALKTSAPTASRPWSKCCQAVKWNASSATHLLLSSHVWLFDPSRICVFWKFGFGNMVFMIMYTHKKIKINWKLLIIKLFFQKVLYMLGTMAKHLMPNKHHVSTSVEQPCNLALASPRMDVGLVWGCSRRTRGLGRNNDHGSQFASRYYCGARKIWLNKWIWDR